MLYSLRIIFLAFESSLFPETHFHYWPCNDLQPGAQFFANYIFFGVTTSSLTGLKGMLAQATLSYSQITDDLSQRNEQSGSRRGTRPVRRLLGPAEAARRRATERSCRSAAEVRGEPPKSQLRVWFNADRRFY